MTGNRTSPAQRAPDMRRELRRRLIVGLSGLGVMLLLVALASLLTRQARQDAAMAKAQAQAAGVTAPGTTTPANNDEPLADLGVARSTDAAVPVTATPAPAAPSTSAVTNGNGGAVVVPDLQPDPELKDSKAGQ